MILLLAITARVAATVLLLVLVARGSRVALVLVLGLMVVTIELLVLTQARILRALENAERVRAYAAVLEAAAQLDRKGD